MRGPFDGAPRVCGDDPIADNAIESWYLVLPAYAGMILSRGPR